MECSLDTRLQANKVFIISSTSDDEDELHTMMLLDKRMGLPDRPGCYEEQLEKQGTTSALRPGSTVQSQSPHSLSLTTSRSSRCHQSSLESRCTFSKICIPNNSTTSRRFLFARPKRQMSF